jgi:hypothetical protein
MLASMESAADFSWGGADKRIGHLLFATHPPHHRTTREWLYASVPCLMILAAVNL